MPDDAKYLELKEDYNNLQTRYEDVILFKQDQCYSIFNIGYISGYKKDDMSKKKVQICGVLK